MIEKLYNKKGFTALEVILTTAIAAIIMGAIGGFLVISTKSYGITQEIVDMQYQGQVVLNTVIEDIIYAKDLLAIYDTDPNPKMSETTAVTASLFVLAINDGGIEKYHYYKVLDNSLYVMESTTKDLSYGYFRPELSNLLARNISSIQLAPQAATFKDTKSIMVTLNLETKEKKLKLTNQALMRNKN